MQKKLRALLGAWLSVCLALCLTACAGSQDEGWLSPMMAVSLDESSISVYEGFELANLNVGAITPEALVELGSVTKANLQLAYKGSGDYKIRINVRIDRVEVEEDGSIGHNIIEYGASKSHVGVLYYAEQTWFDNSYGANAESGGYTLFDNRYYSEQDAKYSASRRAIAFNKHTASNYSSINFYIVGLIDGYYALSFYIEADDSHGHFHGINKLALTTALISVGTPAYEAGGGLS